MRHGQVIGLGVLLLTAHAGSLAQTPAGTAFTYQGQLKKAGAPVNNTADFQFSLWDAVSGGSQVGVTVAVNNVTVQNGAFVVVLDFGGAAFDGNARWLEIAVRSPAGGGAYTTLSPRQELTSTPYALYAQTGSATALQGRALSAAPPSTGQVVKWDGLAWAPAGDDDTTYTAGTGLTLAGTQFSLNLAYTDGRYIEEGQAAAGDLSLTYPAPQVDGLQGRPVSPNAPNAGQVLEWSGTTWAPAADNDTTYTASTGLTLAGTQFSLDLTYADNRYVNEAQSAGGDLSGSYPNPTVARLQGRAVSTGAPAAGQVLEWSGSAWAPAADDNTTYTAGTGLTLAGTQFSLNTGYTDGLYVNEAQGNSVSTGMIQDGAVTFSKLSDPLTIGATYWDWDITSGEIDIDITSDYPAINIESTCTTYGDCLALRSSAAAGTSTWLLYAYTLNGNSGYFSKSTDDNAYAVYIASPANNSEGLYVYGNTVATGTKSAAIETSQGPQAIFSVESPEVEIYASGSAFLSGGKAYVELDPLFTEAVSPHMEIRVTVTPVGGWSALYLESTSPKGFAVSSAAGDQNVRFHWMACGRRLGYETRPYVAIPDADEDAAIRESKERAHAAKKRNH